MLTAKEKEFKCKLITWLLLRGMPPTEERNHEGRSDRVVAKRKGNGADLVWLSHSQIDDAL